MWMQDVAPVAPQVARGQNCIWGRVRRAHQPDALTMHIYPAKQRALGQPHMSLLHQKSICLDTSGDIWPRQQASLLRFYLGAFQQSAMRHRATDIRGFAWANKGSCGPDHMLGQGSSVLRYIILPPETLN